MLRRTLHACYSRMRPSPPSVQNGNYRFGEPHYRNHSAKAESLRDALQMDLRTNRLVNYRWKQAILAAGLVA